MYIYIYKISVGVGACSRDWLEPSDILQVLASRQHHWSRSIDGDRYTGLFSVDEKVEEKPMIETGLFLLYVYTVRRGKE